jgi:hypothetical protein
MPLTEHQLAKIALMERAGLDSEAADRLLADEPQRFNSSNDTSRPFKPSSTHEWRLSYSADGRHRRRVAPSRPRQHGRRRPNETSLLRERELIRPHFGNAVDAMADTDVLINAGIEKSPKQLREDEVYERRVRLLGDKVPTSREPISTGSPDILKEVL